MPKQYEAIRDRLIAQGLAERAAKQYAARIYNSRHPDAPVTRKESTSKGGSSAKRQETQKRR